jgi:hypothetical protein
MLQNKSNNQVLPSKMGTVFVYKASTQYNRAQKDLLKALKQLASVCKNGQECFMGAVISLMVSGTVFDAFLSLIK